MLITGTATHICCESSARDAMMLNFKTVMVADGLAANSDEEHNASLSGLYGQFADVQTVDEVVQSLERGDQARAAASFRQRLVISRQQPGDHPDLVAGIFGQPGAD